MIERGRKHRRVIGVDRHRDTGRDEAGQRMLSQRRHRPGADVRGRADLERDAVLDEIGQQPLVLDGVNAVPDAFGAEEVDRVPDRLGAGRFARVGHAVQAGRPSLIEVGLELGPVDAEFRAAQPETDQPGRALLERRRQRCLGGGPAGLTRRCRNTSAARDRSRVERGCGRPRSPGRTRARRSRCESSYRG